jgi:hypothetical protein
MAVKYECPKCNRRFAEWGAEKYGFKCPGDEWCPADRPKDIDLVRVGAAEGKSGKRPSLKRTPRRTSAPIPVPIEIEEEEDGMTEVFEAPEEEIEVEVMAGVPDAVVPVDEFAADDETIGISPGADEPLDLDLPDEEFAGDALPASEIPAESEESTEEF